MNHYTTIDQSKHLLELGLKAETADMYYQSMEDNIPNTHPMIIGGDYYKGEDLPCWSVGALLELMPPTIKPEDREESCNMEFFKGLSGKFHFRYMGAGGPTDMLNLVMGTPIECAYQMICWLLQNNYIKTE